MSISKKYLKKKPICKVTFNLPAKSVKAAKKVAIVGEFNNWDPKEAPMRKLKDGTFTRTLDLEVGKEYQFRYLINESVWYNDVEADRFAPTGVSLEENSIVVV
jgi:1,4-alpha-glucan branching enzyme